MNEINQDIVKAGETQTENINYNIFNALNLMNEKLGQSYLDSGFNPFGEDFVLSEEFVEDVLENNNDKKDLVTPDFLLHGQKIADMAFSNSMENSLLILDKLNEMMNNPDLPQKIKLQVKKLIEYILCRNEMIKIYLKKKKKERDTLKTYQDLSALNWQFSNCFEASYNKEFNINATLLPLVTALYARADKVSARESAIVDMAKQIIENNAKMQMAKSEIEKLENKPKYTTQKPSIKVDTQKSSSNGQEMGR